MGPGTATYDPIDAPGHIIAQTGANTNRRSGGFIFVFEFMVVLDGVATGPSKGNSFRLHSRVSDHLFCHISPSTKHGIPLLAFARDKRTAGEPVHGPVHEQRNEPA